MDDDLGKHKQDWRTETGKGVRQAVLVNTLLLLASGGHLGIGFPEHCMGLALRVSCLCMGKPGYSSSLLSIISIACDFINAAIISRYCLGEYRRSLTYDGSCM